MAYEPWTKIDGGAEGAWAPEVWLGVIDAIAKNEGQEVYNASSKIYADLKKNFPQLTWTSDDGGTFRPYFRDFGKPWTITGAATFENIFQLTEGGRKVANGKLSAKDFLLSFCRKYSESNELPFCILADAFLKLSSPLTLAQVHFGIVTAYRPGVDNLEDSLKLAVDKSDSDIPSVPKRRLTLMLAIFERVGCVIKTGSGASQLWRRWDYAALQTLSNALIKSTTEVTTDPTALTGIDTSFIQDAKAAKMTLESDLPTNFIASLLTKPFLILTGLSGSGKTKVAQAFASWICSDESQYRVVAVGADWTSNENIVGYPDALLVGTYRKPSNGALDLILKAEDNPALPYFLILDEMNLSHVERYFADVLSAIESGQEIALHSSSEKLKSSEDDAVLVPAKVRLPKNLFIVGTVNVDETTYMFSPKVLDRANVIEFRANATDIERFLDSPSKIDLKLIAGKGAKYANALVTNGGSSAVLADEAALKVKEALSKIFLTLSPIGAEFGFRTAYEIARFFFFHQQLKGEQWSFEAALDAQILQKLLPKLHGSERRLGGVLKVLADYCSNNQCPKSLRKIQRMQDRLRDGFTSFAEA